MQNTHFYKPFYFKRKYFICPINRFFITINILIHKDNINWRADTFDNKVQFYFKDGRVVKDDQIIIIHCIAENYEKFEIIQEHNQPFDNWFLFQRWLK